MRHLIAWTILFVGLILVGLSLFGLGSNLLQDRRPNFSTPGERLASLSHTVFRERNFSAPSSLEPYVPKVTERSHEGPHLAFLFSNTEGAPNAQLPVQISVESINTGDGRISFAVSPFRNDVSSQFALQLYDSARSQYLVSRESVTLRNEYWNASFELTFTGLMGNGATSIPIRLFVPNAPSEEEVRRFDMPLSGGPQLYPSDWYWAGGEIGAKFPMNIVFRPAKEVSTRGENIELSPCEPNCVDTLPDVIYFYGAGPGMIGYKTLVLLGKPTDRPYSPAHFLVTRDTPTKVYVYGLSFIPLILGLIIVAAVAAGDDKASDDVGVLVGFVAAALAVLPLRAVLVPTEIHGLTRVDFILSFDLAVMVCIAAIATWRRMRRARHTRATVRERLKTSPGPGASDRREPDKLTTE